MSGLIKKLFDDNNDNSDTFNQINISIASPEQIESWSYGEIKKPETINYRTLKPENDGLFCAKIFGPTKDYECLCGKYSKMRYRGLVCEKCGVEVTTSNVRRKRMGHINLAVPVVHIWFLRSLPSRISILLDVSLSDIERILYFDAYIITDPGISDFSVGDIIRESDFDKAQNEYGQDSFKAEMGAEAIYTLLSNLNLPKLRENLYSEFKNSNSVAKQKKIAKRLKLINEFCDSSNEPKFMVIKKLPVIPPDLRPLVPLEGGRFASADLNDLYRRIINRNNRLKRLIELFAPEVIQRNEKRMLQEAVDALLDNGSSRGKPVTTSNKRPLKSLSDLLKGKQGRFRKNLLGKRVDYSARSVIIVGPQLKLQQCGLPKKIALELYKPFLYAKLELYGIATTIKTAKKMVIEERPEVLEILEKVMRQHPVLLNRAPTLHRLGIQAFEPVLIEGKAIQLHPLVCQAFNADFDGDSMSVHLPLSLEAQLEARVLMMSTNNILSPTNGLPIIVPDQDIILGLYYLTLKKNNAVGDGKMFADIAEIEYALEQKIITLHTKIKFKTKVPNIDNVYVDVILDTTPGRVIFSKVFPKHPQIHLGTVNKVINKKNIVTFTDLVYRCCGLKATVIFIDHIMKLGLKYSCISGVSFGMDDMVIPESKSRHLNFVLNEIKVFEKQYEEGLITSGEKYNKLIDSWTHCTERIAYDLMNLISKGVHKDDESYDGELNSIYIMFDSGARGSPAQIKQISGMKGLMVKSSGSIIETPIISNFIEGLNVAEYFISTYGSRKGLADTALKTANSGYLTRRLVDVALDVIITEFDCGTVDGITISNIMDAGEVVVSLSKRTLGRVVVGDVIDSNTNSIIVNKGEIISKDIINKMEVAGIDSVKVRSIIMCKTKHGVCAKCYGCDLSTGKLVDLGEAVGVIAAQSIGEPGTQLTMNTFHIGGTALTKKVKDSSIEAPFDSNIRILNANLVTNSENDDVVMNRVCNIALINKQGEEKAKYSIPYGAKILKKDKAFVKKGEKISEWNPYNIHILSAKSGIAVFNDIIEESSVKEVVDNVTGITSKIIIHDRQHSQTSKLKPSVSIVDEHGNKVILSNGLEAQYYLPVNATLVIEDGDYIKAGDVIAKMSCESTGVKDITGGLSRVIELVEAQKPKDSAVVAYCSGKIKFGKDTKTRRQILLEDEDKDKVFKYMIHKNKHILVQEGDIVRKGDVLVDGSSMLQDILDTMGKEALVEYMVNEIQAVYRLQGVEINDKHIEIIITKMLQKVEITDSGNTMLFVGEKIDQHDFEKINQDTIKKDLVPAKAKTLIQSITKASLQTRSFIAAASFQETTRVLIEAAIKGKKDKLKGLKESIIVGGLPPVGTGFLVSKLLNSKNKEEQESIL